LEEFDGSTLTFRKVNQAGYERGRIGRALRLALYRIDTVIVTAFAGVQAPD